MSVNSRLQNQFIRPAVVGAMSYVTSMLLVGGKDTVTLPLVGGTVDIHVFNALLGTGASLGTEVIANWIIPYIPQDGKSASYEIAVARPAIHGALAYGLTAVLYPSINNRVGMGKIAGHAFLAEFGADYVYNNFIAPMHQ